MKIKESKKMSHKDVERFFDTLQLIGKGFTGTKQQSETALSVFYSLIMSRRQVVSTICDMLTPIDRKPMGSRLILKGLVQDKIDTEIAERLATFACKVLYLDKLTELDNERENYHSTRAYNFHVCCFKTAKYKFCYEVVYRQLAKIAKSLSLMNEYFTFLSACEAEVLESLGTEGAPLFGDQTI